MRRHYSQSKFIISNSQFHTALEAWYEQHKRVLPWRETTDPYKVWLSEIILQQTRVQQGMEYYLRFVSQWPTVQDLAAANEDDVLLAWQGLGYYTRARNLYKAAQMIVHAQRASAEGKVQGAEFPCTFEELTALPGVGEYTAGAILSFAFNAPYPAVDGNVYRVLARLMDCDEAFDTSAGKKLFRTFAWELLDTDHPRLYNSAIMELGALHCTPSLTTEDGTDACSTCPVAAYCLAHQHGTAALLPVRKPRPKVRDRYFLYTAYLTPDGHTLLHKRENKDIWQHLYEFPLQEADAEKQLHFHPHALHIETFTHVLSHQKIHAWFELVQTAALPAIDETIELPWADMQHFALSRLTDKYLEKICATPTILNIK